MKTISLKKVAVVAVASLGFGLMSVVPANAATITVAYTYTATTGGVDSKAGATPGLVGSAVTATPTVTTSSTVLTSALTPMVTTFTVVDPNGTDLTSGVVCTAGADVTNEVTGITVAAGTCAFTYTLPVTANTDAGALGTIVFTPTMAGSYTIKASSPALTTTDTVSAVTAAVSAGVIFVAGANVTIASSGKGTTAGGAVTGGVAKALFAMKAHDNPTTYNLTSSGVGTIQTVVDGAGGGLATVCDVAVPGIAGATDYTQGAAVTCAATTFATAEATFASTVAGVQTLSWTAISATTGAPTVVATATITWGAAPVTAANLSTSIIAVGTGAPGAADAVAVSAASTAQTAAANRAANITVTTANSAGTNITTTTILSATISGPGLLSIETNGNVVAATGRALTGVAGNNVIGVYGDGTSGVATITITAGTVTISTETVTFFGKVATVTAAQNFKVATAGGATLGFGGATANLTTQIPAVVLTLKDSNGNVVPGQNTSLSALSSDTTVMSSSIASTQDDGATVGAGAGTYNVQVNSATGSVTGKSATLTFRFAVGDGTFISSAAVTFSTAKSTVATVTMAFDKASYAQGEAAVLTITAKDSSGNAVADGTKTGIFTAAPVYSKTVTGSLPTADITFVGGVATFKQFAPASSGAYTVNATVNPLVAVAGASISAASSVVDGNAALMTQIDALNAKIVALNALIAKIMKKLGVK